jgi:hypothetical protein
MKSILDLLREEDDECRRIVAMKTNLSVYEDCIEGGVEIAGTDFHELAYRHRKALRAAYQDLVRIRKQIREAVMGQLDI